MNLLPRLTAARTTCSSPISTLLGSVASAAVLACFSATAGAATLTVTPIIDNSIFSESDSSNGTGSLFSGRTPSNGVRRALVQFDLGAIPAGSVIDAVTVSFTQLQIGPGVATNFQLFPVLSVWGEGTSSGAGAGGLATAGDATWNYRLFNTSLWATPGGDLAGTPSATSLFGTANSVYTFASTPGLVADVQSWLSSPSTNHGWALRAADESPTLLSARRFGSRETPSTAPVLTVTYSPVPEPGIGGLLGAAGLASLARRTRRERR